MKKRVVRLIGRLFLRRFQSWAVRDTELNDKWNRALENENYEECERLQYAMRKNWEAYYHRDFVR